MNPEEPVGPASAPSVEAPPQPIPELPNTASILMLLIGSIAVAVSPFLTWSSTRGTADAFDYPLLWFFKWPWSKVSVCQMPSTLKLGHALLALGVVGVLAGLIGVGLRVAQPGANVNLAARAKAWRVVGLIGQIFMLLALALVFDVIIQMIPWGTAPGRDLLSNPGLWVAAIGAIVGSSAPRPRSRHQA